MRVWFDRPSAGAGPARAPRHPRSTAPRAVAAARSEETGPALRDPSARARLSLSLALLAVPRSAPGQSFRQFRLVSLSGVPADSVPGAGRGRRPRPRREVGGAGTSPPRLSEYSFPWHLSFRAEDNRNRYEPLSPLATRAWLLVGGADTKRRPATPPRIPPCSARSRGFLLRPPRAGRSRAGAAAPARPGGSGDPGRKNSGVRPGRATRRWPARSLRGRFPLTPPAAPKSRGERASRRPPPRLPVGALAPGRTGAVPAPRSGGGVPFALPLRGRFLALTHDPQADEARAAGGPGRHVRSKCR